MHPETKGKMPHITEAFSKLSRGKRGPFQREANLWGFARHLQEPWKSGMQGKSFLI
jgi:hypothetical protein